MGQTSILLLSDQVILRNFLSGALTREGISVLSAANYGEAELLASAFSGRIRLLVECTATAEVEHFAARLTAAHPPMRAVVISPTAREQLAALPESGANPPPSLPEDLMNVLRRALSDPELPQTVMTYFGLVS